MLIVMDKEASEEEIAGVAAKIEALGYTAQPMPGGERVAIGILRNSGPVDPALFVDLPGVQEAIPVSRPYKLVSREMKRDDTVIELPVGNLKIGGGNFIVIAGPCAVESEAQALTIAQAVKAAGAQIFRGGAFKPRTSPYSYQGLEEEGLKILATVRAETGMPVITEAIDHASLDLVEGVCRHYPDRGPEHAKLFPAAPGRAGPEAGAPEAGPVRHPGRIFYGCGIYYVRRQHPGNPL